jgi:hypothetical protein
VRALRSFVDTQVANRLLESGGRLTEEGRLVTALFADISGCAEADPIDSPVSAIATASQEIIPTGWLRVKCHRHRLDDVEASA